MSRIGCVFDTHARLRKSTAALFLSLTLLFRRVVLCRHAPRTVLENPHVIIHVLTILPVDTCSCRKSTHTTPFPGRFLMARRSLSNLSDNVLLSRLHELVKNEKQTTLSILRHLAEVDRRDLYLAYGFSSLFDYCVGALGYSRSAAGRRIASARCLRRFPEVHDLLELGEVNLTTIGHVASILNDENRDLLLREIRGKTERQVESIVARYKPPVAYRDRVRPVRVTVPDLGPNSKNRCNSLILNSRSGSGNRSNCGIVHPDGQGEQGPGGGAFGATQREFAALAAPREKSPDTTGIAGHTEKRLLIQFLANEAFMTKLNEVKALLSNKIPGGTFEEVFEVLMNEFIDRHSPEKRTQRREKRQAKKVEKKQQKRDTEKSNKKNVGGVDTDDNKRSRHIPVKTRDAVFKRDDGRCTYVGRNGKRCGSTHGLQIDHIKPFAKGGSNTLSNLRLLCGRHNRHEAKRILGANAMNQYNRREVTGNRQPASPAEAQRISICQTRRSDRSRVLRTSRSQARWGSAS